MHDRPIRLWYQVLPTATAGASSPAITKAPGTTRCGGTSHGAIHADENDAQGVRTLTLTDDAATAIRTLAGQTNLPEETGVRISSTTGEGGPPALGLSVAEGPLPEDQVIEVQGARVFVDSDVAAGLEDKALDAQITGHGQVQFMLADQPG